MIVLSRCNDGGGLSGVVMMKVGICRVTGSCWEGGEVVWFDRWV